MKRHLFVILLALVLVFALAGCEEPVNIDDPNIDDPNIDDPDWTSGSGGWGRLELDSLEELAQAKKEADQENAPLNLKGLDFYYISVYAEERLEFLSGKLYSTSIVFNYSLAEQKQNVFDFWMSRDKEAGEKLLAGTINPDNYLNGDAPKPLEGVEGVYYEKFLYEGEWMMQFHWLNDGYKCSLAILPDLLKEIEEKDPEALKGKLFELQKIELK